MAWSVPGNVSAGGTINASTINAILGDLTILGGPETSYTPTLTLATLGNGTITGRSTQANKMIDLTVVLTFGTTTSVTSGIAVSLPVAAQTANWSTSCTAYDNSANAWTSMTAIATTTTALSIRNVGNPATLPTGTVPFSWATGDILTITARYEAT